MKIGILLCGHAMPEIAERYGDYDYMFSELLSGHGFEFEAYNAVDLEFPSDVQAVDGWLLTGSRYGAYDDLPFIAPLEDFIRDAYSAAVPMVGICFGHQLIAQALGGKVVKFGGGWAIGPQKYDFDGTGSISLNAWHQDQVVVRPADAKVIASNSFCENAALVYGDRILTIQPHPEFGNPIIRDYVAQRRDWPEYPDEIMADAWENLAVPVDNAVAADQIAAFFKQSRVDENV